MGVKKTTPGGKTPAHKKRGSTTFSTRLSATEREQIEDAAGLKNWSTSQLIRIASRDRAVNILNTTPAGFPRQRLGDFANKVGKQLFDDTQRNEDEFGLLQDELDSLQDALKFGGVEFLRLVVESYENLVKLEEKKREGWTNTDYVDPVSQYVNPASPGSDEPEEGQ